MSQETYQMVPIGYIRRADQDIRLEILDTYRPALKELDQFSHVIVFWWADRHDNEASRGVMQTEPPYAPGQICGVFATRAEYRPNPITMCMV